METLHHAARSAEGASSTVTTVNPSTGSALATYDETPRTEIEAVLEEAHRAAALWRQTSASDRASALRRFAAALRERRQELALTATREMGRPLSETLDEVTKCAWACEWFAEHAPAMLEREQLDTEALHSYVVFVPLGVLFAIMPWNARYWQ